MNRVISIMISLLIFLSTAGLATGSDFKIVTEHYPPYIYQEEGKIKGFTANVVIEALTQAGVPTDMEIYPWARTILLAKKNAPLLAFPVSKNEERDAFFNWVGPIAVAEMWLFKLTGREHIKVTSLDDARYLSVGVVRGGIIEEHLKQNEFATLVDVTDIEQGLNMLKLGHIDLFGMDKYSMSYFISLYGLGNKAVEKAYMLESLSREVYLASSKSFPEKLARKIGDEITKIHSSGRYQELEEQFFQELGLK